jgi:5-methyltetrahydrofolate--homocysteine methyltransferase
MHAAFLYHAIAAGMDMGIVNAGQLAVYEEVPKELREKVEERLAHALVKGNADHVEADTLEALEKLGAPLAVTEGRSWPA